MKLLAASSIGLFFGMLFVNIPVASAAVPAYPEGIISMTVQDQTTNSGTTSAITARTGDTLKLAITIRNNANPGKGSTMYYTQLTDMLPAGLQLKNTPSQHTITATIGTINAGNQVTKDYLVKVNDTKQDDALQNKACFTGDSQSKDSPQIGCELVTISTVSTPASIMPSTGSSVVETLSIALFTSLLAYVGRLYFLKKAI